MRMPTFSRKVGNLDFYVNFYDFLPSLANMLGVVFQYLCTHREDSGNWASWGFDWRSPGSCVLAQGPSCHQSHTVASEARSPAPVSRSWRDSERQNGAWHYFTSLPHLQTEKIRSLTRASSCNLQSTMLVGRGIKPEQVQKYVLNSLNWFTFLESH